MIFLSLRPLKSFVYMKEVQTEGMWFGSMAGREDGPVNIKWRTDCIKILGIFFTVSRRDFECLN